MTEARKRMGDSIYGSLMQIQRERGITLVDKALIADFLSTKLIELGYRLPPDEQEVKYATMPGPVMTDAYMKLMHFDDTITN